jgi:hypothetical protein
MRAAHDRIALDRDERAAIDHPWIGDRFTRLALELVEQAVDGDGDARDDRGDVRVHERRQLLAVGTAERPDRGHADLLDIARNREDRHRCGT